MEFPQVGASGTFVEDTYHNTLPEFTITPKNNQQQIGKSTTLSRILNATNSFLGGIKLPPVPFEHSVAKPGMNTYMIGAICIAAYMFLKKK